MKKILFLMIIISAMMTAENADCQTVYTLQQLRDSAVAGNVKISSSRLDAEAVRHRRKEAFTKYFPSVSATGLWFNANKDMAEMEINPSEVIPQELGASLAQSFPPEALAALGNPVTFGMMKDGVIGSVTDSYGAPVIGAAVFVKDTQNGVVTDVNGRYSLPRVTPGSILCLEAGGQLGQAEFHLCDGPCRQAPVQDRRSAAELCRSRFHHRRF